MWLSASRALAWGGHRTSRRLEAQRGEGWQPQVGGVAGGGARVKAEGEMGASVCATCWECEHVG